MYSVTPQACVQHANNHIQKGHLQTFTKYKVWYLRVLDMNNPKQSLLEGGGGGGGRRDQQFICI